MENNNYKNCYDLDIYGQSLSKAISTVAYPCETFQEKIDIVIQKWNAHTGPETLEQKIDAFKSFFKEYYANIELYNYYGLTIIEPWNIQ